MVFIQQALNSVFLSYRKVHFYTGMALISFFFLFFLPQKSVEAQSILIRSDDVRPVLQSLNSGSGLRDTHFVTGFINGPYVHIYQTDASSAMTNDQSSHYYHFGNFGRALLAAATLRLADADKLDLDSPLYTYFPDLFEENPFDVAVTPRHLLTGTAGFAVPAWYKAGRITAGSAALTDQALTAAGPYLIRIRTPGQMFHDDPVALFLLTKLVVNATGLSLSESLDTLIFGTADDLPPLRQTARDSSLFSTLFLSVDGLSGTSGHIAFFLQKLMRYDRSNFLKSESRDRLLTAATWRMHPLGLTRTLGFTRKTAAGHAFLSGGHPCHSGLHFSLFPQQDIAFFHIQPARTHPEQIRQACGTDFTNLTKLIAQQHIPPGTLSNRLTREANTLIEAEMPTGNYVRETLPTADLKGRLLHLQNHIITLSNRNDILTFSDTNPTTSDNKTISFTRRAPFHYEDQDGNALTFSPIASGGYFIYRGETYRFISLLGSKTLLLDPFYWVIFTLLSGAIYVFVGHDISWRRMGLACLLGSSFIAAGLYLDITYWQVFLYETPQIWLIVLWRIMLNIGIAFTLSLPIYVLYFSRTNNMPAGLWLLIAPLHITLLTAASLILFLLLVGWGIAGTLTPY